MVTTTIDHARVEARPGGAVNIWGPVVFALLLAAAAIFFWDGIEALLAAWQTAEYSHGPLIPVLSGYLFLRHLKAEPVQAGEVRDRWQGVLVVLLAIMLGSLGKLARIPDIVAYALIGFIAGVVLISFGWRRGVLFWAAIVHLLFMLPLPGTLYWKVSTYLQFISSEFGVFLIRAMNIPVYLEGNIIDLGVYKLHVAEACSGLRYLFPIMSFSYVFATLYRGPVWHKAVLLLSAAPLAVLMNSLRIGIIGIVVNSYGLEHVEGLTHLLEGWVIFISCVLLLFALAKIMLLMQRTNMSLAESLDLDTAGLGQQIARLRLVQASPALLTALGLVVAVLVAWNFAPQRTVSDIQRQSFAVFPATLGDWQMEGLQVLEPAIERALGADDYYAATFSNPGAPSTDVFMAWYEDQRRHGIHSPEVCLPSGGWEMAQIDRVDMASTFGTTEAFPINRAIIQKGETRLLVYYWFEQYDARTASDFLAKAVLLRSAMRHGRTDGALVRLITPIRQGEDERVAEARLIDIARPLIRELPRFIPQHQGR